MDSYGKIADEIRKIAGIESIRGILFTAKVEEVFKETCSVSLGKLILTDVRLRAIVSGGDDSIIIKPRRGSVVLVGDLTGGNKRQLAVLSYSEIDEVSLKIREQTLVVDENGLVFNGGNNEGVVKVSEMVNWMRKVYQDLLQLQTQLASHPVVGNGAPLAMAFSPKTPNPLQDSFENKKIKH